MNFYLASGNSHKVSEFQKLLNSEEVMVKECPTKIEVVEDGLTFRENALKKAEAYFKKLKEPVLSDDSGLICEALPGELGIHTARFGGEGLSDRARCEKLLERMENIENRGAYFVCHLCFYISPDEIYFFEGRLDGEIAKNASGQNGFGYDPVFIATKNPNGTISENEEWKMNHSHRAVACKHALDFFKGRKRR